MHPIEQKIYSFLEACATRDAKVDEKLVKEFGKTCEEALKKHLLEPEEKGFRLRMSNIGRPLRQLMLEKKYGRKVPSPNFLLKMLAGSLDEAFMVFLLKASGVNVEEEQKAVSLPVLGTKLEGTFDVKIDGKIYDIKTASPFSYENKFSGYESVTKGDTFGYTAQGFGYAQADASPFGGWIVRNKATQEFKVVDIPAYAHDELKSEYVQNIKVTVNHILKDKPMPACEGVVEETFYNKGTGNLILGKACTYCSHKELCHPGIQYRQSLVGKGKSYKYYTKIDEKYEKEDE